jgi:hypothetical protein
MVPIKTLSLICAVLCSTSAVAECYLQSTTLNALRGRIERTADITRSIAPGADNQLSCVVTFRVLVDAQWYTAQGSASGASSIGEAQLCAQAMDYGRSRVLQNIAGSQTSVNQDMICTDGAPKWKPVEIGMIVKESEVSPHPDPRKRAYWECMPGTEGRWFIETMPAGAGQGGMVQNLGVICRLRGDQWLVKDKWVNMVDK